MKPVIFVVILILVGSVGLVGYRSLVPTDLASLPVGVGGEQQLVDYGTDAPDITRPADGAVAPVLVVYSHMATLEDVTGGQAIRGTEFERLPAGVAQARFESGEYQLLAEFDELPDPSGDDFYEGWVVRAEPLSVVSTGALERSATGVYTNLFTSSENLLDHARYVLTLEPNEEDPAPADHVLDGVFGEI